MALSHHEQSSFLLWLLRPSLLGGQAGFINWLTYMDSDDVAPETVGLCLSLAYLFFAKPADEGGDGRTYLLNPLNYDVIVQCGSKIRAES